MSLTYAPAQLVLTLVQLPGSWLPSVTPARRRLSPIFGGMVLKKNVWFALDILVPD